MKYLWGASVVALTMAAAPALAADNAEDASAAERESSTIIVNGQKAIGDGQVATTARVGILGSLDALDTPFSVSSLTSDFIDNQMARSLTEVIENDASVRSASNATRGSSWTTSFFIRGFNANLPDQLSINGLYGLANYTPVINYVERVDIFKGPSAFLSGAPGAVGGSFNFAPKRAQAQAKRHVEVDYLSDALFGVAVDVGQRSADGRFGVRFNGQYRSGDNAIDGGSMKQKNAALGLDYADGGLRVAADLIYEYTNSPGYNYAVDLGSYPLTSPFPAAASGSHRTQPSWMAAGYDARIGLIRAEYDFAKNWTVSAAYGHSFTTGGYDAYCSVTLLNVAGDARCSVFGYYSEEKNDSADISVNGKFDTGPINHSVVFGGNYLNRVASNNGGTTFPTSYTFNYYSDDRPARPAFPTAAILLASKRQITGYFLGDTMGIANDMVTLTVGARNTTIKAQAFNRLGARTSISDESKWTPMVAGTFKPSEHLSFYANYIQALEPGGIAPGTASNAGATFPPLVSNQIEAGLKARFGQILATAAAFRIRKANQFLDSRTTPPTYTQDGLQQNEGIELSLAGRVVPHLNIIASTAWIRAKQLRTQNGTLDGKRAPAVPDFSARLDLTYELPFVEGFSVNGGLMHNSLNWLDNLNTRKAPGWTRLDAGASYRFTVGTTKLTARASVENVTAERYFVAAGSNLVFQGAPRTVALGLAVDF